MFSIKLRPRGYRVQMYLRTDPVTGGPKYSFMVQVQTRFGWSNLRSYDNEQEAQRICAEWMETLQ